MLDVTKCKAYAYECPEQDWALIIVDNGEEQFQTFFPGVSELGSFYANQLLGFGESLIARWIWMPARNRVHRVDNLDQTSLEKDVLYPGRGEHRDPTSGSFTFQTHRKAKERKAKRLGLPA